MKQLSLAILCSAALIFTGCRNENQSAEDRVEENALETQDEMQAEDASTENEEPKELTINIEPRSNSKLSGEAVFTEENGEVTLVATVSGLTEGQHAIHIHEKADCSADDGSSAGGHWNPTMEDHGKWGEGEYHRGDIGNFDVDADGNGSITFSTDEWCIGCDDEKRNIVGKSIMIHEGVDDFTSQPSGNAGARVGCGEIQM